MNKIKITEKEVRNFWSKVKIGTANACWPWVGAKGSNGYGVVSLGARPDRKARQHGAHRISLLIAGKNVDGFSVLHSCDNPICVNPHHLRTGDGAASVAGGVSRGRGNPVRGEKCKNATLTDEAVREIRRAGSTFEGVCKMMLKYRQSQGNIQSVFNRKSWKHVK